MADDEIYYAHAGALPFVRRFSWIARARIIERILAVLKPTSATTIVDIGTSDETTVESNMLQQRYPYRDALTCASLSDGSIITKAYPGVKHVRIQRNAPLPFRDGQFSCAYSNAVIEHCGDLEQQRFFLSEMCRVSRSQFVVAPNPWFPVEHHTGLPFVHWLPKVVFRFLLSRSPWFHWANVENLNYITIDETLRIWPGESVGSEFCGIGYGLFSSNFMVYHLESAVEGLNSRQQQ